MEYLKLFIISSLPVIFFLILILSKDRHEKEPFGLIIKTFIYGCLFVIPAGYLETLFMREMTTISNIIFNCFVVIATIEEVCKTLACYLSVWKDKNFNEENDGIVYFTTSALGFAFVENIFYVFSLGFSTGMARAISAIPLHVFTGVIIGYYFGIAKFTENKETANKLYSKGFFTAWFVHGLYDSILFLNIPVFSNLVWILCSLYSIILIFKIVNKGSYISFLRHNKNITVNPDEVLKEEIESPINFLKDIFKGFRNILIFILKILIVILWLFIIYLGLTDTEFSLSDLLISGFFISIILLIPILILERKGK